MAITAGSLIPTGMRVRVRRGRFPLDPSVIGREGRVVDATPYRARSYGVVLDGEQRLRMFSRDELESIGEHTLPPEHEAAKKRRALP